jgi:5-(carboxyamino)imidazole ribonucleotide synthase
MFDRISLLRPYRIAIVGGGQLGKMMTVAAKQFGFHVTVLDPTAGSPAAQVADQQVVAAFTDGEAIRSLATEADVIIYEFEHINTAALLALEEQGCLVFPTPKILQVIQDKLLQKRTMAMAGIPVPPFQPVSSTDQVKEAAAKFGYPLMLKARSGGYDGKGNFLIGDPEAIEVGFNSLRGSEMMAEKFIRFTCEVSVIVARSRYGEVKIYPLSENEHDDNILRRSIVPARVPDVVVNRAQSVAEAVISLFSGVGVFCVEMFVTPEGDVLVNEVAPRPHNSGHYTIEACVTSQFEQHIRATCGLPLGDTSLRCAAVMVNLLGEKGYNGPAVLEGCSSALSLPGVHLHFYGKRITVPKRKMGHITVTALKLEEALQIATRAEQLLRVIAEKGGEK